MVYQLQVNLLFLDLSKVFVCLNNFKLLRKQKRIEYLFELMFDVDI